MGTIAVLNSVLAKELETKGFKCYKRDKDMFMFYETVELKNYLSKAGRFAAKDYIVDKTVKF